ncbi:MAG: restriction endonuclease, partial [Chloroflexi bacterium]|nr:restriction endonuclease [Chloroflexota bacterium]
EEGLQTVRGRIRFNEQIRRRFGIPLPVEVRYDEFTDDILENRLVKAAVLRLGAMRLRSPNARRGLGWIAGMLEGVSHAEFSPRDVPDVSFDRLNEHYRDVVGLSRLILEHSAFEAGRGTVRATGFLMDMNVVFQEFVTVALREALGLSAHVLLEKRIQSLDVGGKVRLRPDLTWWDGGNCVFVGDAKYKDLDDKSVRPDDLYQLLAYTTSLDLPGGLLIYAQGGADTAVYKVRHAGKTLEVAALDLSGEFEDVLARVGILAQRVKALRDEARGLRRAS